MDQDLLKDVVYRRIKELIISGFFPMGSKLSEVKLGELLKVKIAPVRDALKRLESEKLVIRKPKSGTYVFNINQRQLDKLLNFRYVIESEAAVLSCREDNIKLALDLGAVQDVMLMDHRNCNMSDYLKQDSIFHRTLVDHCDNPYYVESYHLIANIMDTVRNCLGNNEDHLKRSLDQHDEIIESIRRNDLITLKDTLAKHILPERGAYWTEKNISGKLSSLFE